jgi:hypothetical protein
MMLDKRLAVAAVAAASLGAGSAHAIELDKDVTSNIIFGSGNANGGFAVFNDGNIELGLRAKVRYGAGCAPANAFPGAGTGVYTFAVNDGSCDGAGAAGRSFWNVEWSAISDLDGTPDTFLDQYVFQLGVDTDQSAGTNLVFGNLTQELPGYYGDLSTANGGGTSAGPMSGLEASNVVVQQSWNYAFFGIPFDASAAGIFDFTLSAFDLNGGLVGTTAIQVVQGTPIPAPTTLALIGLGLFGLGFSRARSH